MMGPYRFPLVAGPCWNPCEACRTDPEIRSLLGLPMHIRQEDGSRDAFEAVFQRLDADDSKSIDLREFIDVFGPAPEAGPVQNCRVSSVICRIHIDGYPHKHRIKEEDES